MIKLLQLSVLVMVSFVVTFPSYVTLPLLLYAWIVILSPASVFAASRFWSLGYFAVVIALQYVVNWCEFGPDEVFLQSAQFFIHGVTSSVHAFKG